MTRLAFALTILAAPAAAQPIACAPHSAMTAYLSQSEGQSQQAVALERSGNLIETWADLETGRWTLVMVAPDGAACIVALGPLFELRAGLEGVDG
jgi:hypothetical protein